jgi:hypothetical protein
MSRKRKIEDVCETDTDEAAPLQTKTDWRQHARACLLEFMISDLLNIVMSYAAGISAEMSRVLVQRTSFDGNTDGQFKSPGQMELAGDELLVSDLERRDIQFFHFPSGRFLRKLTDICSFSSVGFAADLEKDLLYVSNTTYISVVGLHDFRTKRILARKSQRYGDNMDSDCLLLCKTRNLLFLPMSRPGLMVGGASRIKAIDTESGKVVSELRLPRDKSLENASIRFLSCSEDDSELLVADEAQNCVHVVDTKTRQAVPERQYGKGGFLLWRPQHAVFFGSQVIVCGFGGIDRRHLYTLDRDTGVLTKKVLFDGDGTPSHLALSSKTNELLVLDSLNGRVVVYH